MNMAENATVLMCREKFREWLKEKYGTIENLNSSWCTTFWSHTYNSFDQIESPSPKGENALHALTLDWKRFVTDRTVDFMKHEISAIRAGGSELPATANLMYDYNGLDYKKFKDVMDIASWDNYPSWHKKDNYTTAVGRSRQHDLMRSIKKASFLLMESIVPLRPTGSLSTKLKKPEYIWLPLCRQLLMVQTVFCISSFVRAREPLRNSMVR